MITFNVQTKKTDDQIHFFLFLVNKDTHLVSGTQRQYHEQDEMPKGMVLSSPHLCFVELVFSIVLHGAVNVIWQAKNYKPTSDVNC